MCPLPGTCPAGGSLAPVTTSALGEAVPPARLAVCAGVSPPDPRGCLVRAGGRTETRPGQIASAFRRRCLQPLRGPRGPASRVWGTVPTRPSGAISAREGRGGIATPYFVDAGRQAGALRLQGWRSQVGPGAAYAAGGSAQECCSSSVRKRQGHTCCFSPHPGLPCRVCRQTDHGVARTQATTSVSPCAAAWSAA